MATKENDYTKYRTVGVIPYEIEDKIGRPDSVDKTKVTNMTVTSGIYTLLPSSPLGRRNYISVVNTGANDIMIVTVSGETDGVVLSTDEAFADDTDAILYVYSTAGDSTVQVYERSTR